MCRGLALGINKQGKVVCKGISSHTNTLDDEDEYVKYEIIIDDSKNCGYAVELDKQYQRSNGKIDEVVIEKLSWGVCKNGKPEQKYDKLVRKWVSDNELQVLRWLLQNRAYAKSKKDNNNSCQETGGDTYNSWQETGGDTDNSYQKTGGNIYNDSQKTGGDTDNSSQKTGGNTYNSYQKTGGDTYNSNQKTGGEWYMGLIKLKKYPNTTRLIQEAKKYWNLTIVELISWVHNNPDKVKKIMRKELK